MRQGGLHSYCLIKRMKLKLGPKMEAENVSDSVGLNAAEGAKTDAYKRVFC